MRWLTACLAAMLAVVSLTTASLDVAAQETKTPTLGVAWTSAELRDHPLVGKIWSTPKKAFTDPSEFEATLIKAHFVLLGEVHDNPDHHKVQAYAVSVLARASERRPIIMEMLKADQERELSGLFAGAGPIGSTTFFDRVGWDKSGWPSRDIYRPLIDSALTAGYRLYAGSDKRSAVRALSKGGLAKLSNADKQSLGLDRDLPPNMAMALTKELEESHCGLLPSRALSGMALVQRYRDGYMARALVAAAAPTGAILIAGNGHVRSDRGVPWVLRQLAPEKSIVSVQIMEVQEGQHDPAAYVSTNDKQLSAADFVIFTPRTQRPDPCEALRNRQR